jgi:hypothetical protein
MDNEGHNDSRHIFNEAVRMKIKESSPSKRADNKIRNLAKINWKSAGSSVDAFKAWSNAKKRPVDGWTLFGAFEAGRDSRDEEVRRLKNTNGGAK